MKTVIKLERLNGIENTVFSDKEYNRCNMMDICLFDNCNEEKIKNIIIDKVIKTIPRLRMKIVKKYMNSIGQQFH